MIREFLSQLLEQDIKLWVDDGRLLYSAPHGIMTTELQARLISHKEELISYLQASVKGVDASSLSITSRTRERTPLSFAQQRLWFIDQLEPGSAAYNIPMAIRLHGPLDVAALEQGLKQIVQRHETLRTTFQVVAGEPYQVIAPEVSVSLPLDDLSAMAKAEREIEVERRAREEAQRPFDLAKGPLVRCSLLKLGADEHILILTMHHIVSDGWSMDILFREIVLLAQAYAAGQPSPLPDLPLQYVDFAIWQREWLQGEVLEAQLNYWKKQLGNAPAVLELPADFPRPVVQTFHGAHLPVNVSRELHTALQALSRQENVSLFMTLLAAFQCLLSRYSGQTDILIGSPVANRNRTETEGLIGFFVNTLVLRSDLSGNPTFHEILRRVREMTIGAYDHQDVPFEKLVDEVQVRRDPGRNPLFQVTFTLQNAPSNIPDLLGLRAHRIEIEQGTSHFDLSLSLQETPAGLRGSLEYNTDLFRPDTMARLLEHFQVLLEGLVADPQRRLADLPLLTSAERRQILVEWNDTQIPYPLEGCIHKLFEAQVEKTPDAVALVFAEEQLTYRQLNQRANQLACYLQIQGVGPDVAVGICIERSPEMIIGLLGILKAGGFYVPLDPAYPQNRLSFMLEDCRAKLVLTRTTLRASLSHLAGVEFILLDTDGQRIAAFPTANLATAVDAANLAYVMYTSGSTGVPKGVAITHQNVLRLILPGNTYAQMTASEVFLQFAPLAFDASTFEIWGCLLNGARLVPFPDYFPTPDELARFVRAHQVTTLWLTAGLFHQVVDAAPNDLGTVRQLLAGGDVLSVAHLQKAQRIWPDCRFINGYGPTESTTFTCCDDVSHGLAVSAPIGRPIANTQVYVLDRQLVPVPLGVAGELCIAGDGLARGYHNQPQLTAGKFVPNPFSRQPGARMYRTGDLVRCLSDGRIEFLGRIDHQVKLRGFRIELGEIESVLAKYPGIKEAVAIVREDQPGDKRLVAYLVSGPAIKISSSDLRGTLKTRLPDYMIPSAFVFIDQLPLSPNGKIDRKVLPAPDQERRDLANGYVAPGSLAEKTLAEIWGQVLDLKQVGIHDNFFELGGDSLQVLRVVAKLHQAGLHFSPQDFFRNQTIAELAVRAETTETPVEQQAPVTGLLPLTGAQRAFFSQEWQYPNHVNQARLIEVPAGLDPHGLEQIVRYLWIYHDALRTRFVHTPAGWRQSIAAPAENAAVPFSYIDFSGLPAAELTETIERTADEIQRRLDVLEGPLTRVVLLNLGADRPGRLLIVLHHLVYDMSSNIFFEDFFTLFQQFSRGEALHLPPKTSPIWQWLERVDAYAQSPALHKELDYWVSLPWTEIHPLPLDYPESRELNTWGSAHSFPMRLSKEETDVLLKEIPKAYDVRIADVLITALVQTMAHWNGDRFALLDVIDSGRNVIPNTADLDLSRTIGWFSMGRRLALEKGGFDRPAEEVLQSVAAQLKKIPNQGIGFELLQYGNEDKETVAKLQQLPQAQILFNYLGRQAGKKKFVEAYEYPGPTCDPRNQRVFVLDCTALILGGCLVTNWRFSRNLHKQATVKNVAEYYVQWLRALVAGHGSGK